MTEGSLGVVPVPFWHQFSRCRGGYGKGTWADGRCISVLSPLRDRLTRRRGSRASGNSCWFSVLVPKSLPHIPVTRYSLTPYKSSPWRGRLNAEICSVVSP